jgi:PH domain
LLFPTAQMLASRAAVSLSDTLATTNVAEVLLADQGYRKIRRDGSARPPPPKHPRSVETDFQRRARARQKVQQMRQQERQAVVTESEPGSPGPAPPIVRDSNYVVQRRRFATMAPGAEQHRAELTPATFVAPATEAPTPVAIQPTSAVSLVLSKEGVLRKRGIESLDWRTRFVRCDGTKFEYFGDRSETEPRGQLLLSEIAEVHQVVGRPHAFLLQSGEFEFHLQAASVAECDGWVRMLLRCISGLSSSQETASVEAASVDAWEADDKMSEEPEKWEGPDDASPSPAAPIAAAPVPAPTRSLRSKTADPPRESLPPHLLEQIPGLSDIAVDQDGEPQIEQATSVVLSNDGALSVAEMSEKVKYLESTVVVLKDSLDAALKRISELERRL